MSAISFAPLLLAGIASVLVSQLWYSPRLFGTAWMRLTNISPEQVEQGKRRMWLSALLGLLASMLIAYVLAFIADEVHATTAGSSIGIGVLCWLGFCVPALLSQVLWDQKPVALFLINASYWLLSFVVIAVILFYTGALQ